MDRTHLNPTETLAYDLLNSISSFAINGQAEITGTCVVERVNQEPVVLAYSAYPNGDYMIWYNDHGNFRLYAIVNESMKHIATIPASDAKALQDKINEFKGQIGKSKKKKIDNGD